MVLGNGKSSQWIHNPDSLVNGRITYSVKFLGKAEVPEPRGMEMVKAALQKLNFSRQIKRTEGTKPPKVELSININSVTISNIKTKETWHDIALHRVSFCADDKTDRRLFAFIAKLDDNKHYCYGLDSVHQANDITLTIGQAFEIAYEKFMKKNPSAPSSKKVNDMSKRIKELEGENEKLRKRIAELENAADGRPAHERVDATPMSSQLFASSTTPERSANLDAGSVAVPRSASPRTTGVTSPEMIDPFNMRPFVPTIPRPPSRGTRLVAMQANPFPGEPFAPAPHSGVSPKDILDMQMIFGEHITSDDDRPTSECDIKEVVRSMFSGIGGAEESKLHVAARRGNHELVRSLLSGRPIKPRQLHIDMSRHPDLSFDREEFYGEITEAGERLARESLNRRDKFGCTSLWIAASRGHSETVRVLCESGAEC